MIITNNSPPSPNKGSANLPPQAGPSAPPPPTYQAAAGDISHAAYRQYVTQEPRESAGKRFFKAWLVAVFIWFIIGALVRSIVWVSHGHRTGPGGWVSLEYPIPDDVVLGDCALPTFQSTSPVGHSYPYYVETSFDLPVDSDTLFLLARGSMASGAVDITTSSDLKDVAKVDVKVYYYRQDILDSAKICAIKHEKRRHGGTSSGVGIFTPRSWWGYRGREDRLFFDVKVLLPHGAKGPLYIKNFETDLPNYSHTIADLESLINFDTLSLSTTNSAITAESVRVQTGKVRSSNGLLNFKNLYADSAELTTTNSMIKGYFNATGTVVLRSSNGPIQATVDLYGDSNGQGLVELTTSNNLLDSTVKLHSASSHAHGFTVTARTSNGRLLLNVPVSPVGSTLTLDARTSNSIAEVSLPPAYEGSFSMFTSNSLPRLNTRTIDDPEGRGRTRSIVKRTPAKGHVDGDVYWDEENRRKGSATVRTSNGAVTLNL